MRYITPIALTALSLLWLGACSGARNASTAPTATAPNSRPTVSSAEYQAMNTRYVGGVNLYRKGEYEKAVRVLDPVWNWDPDYLNVAMYLSRCCLLAGLEYYAEQQYDEAIEVWQRAVAVDPENPKAKRYLARAQEESSRLNAAR